LFVKLARSSDYRSAEMVTRPHTSQPYERTLVSVSHTVSLKSDARELMHGPRSLLAVIPNFSHLLKECYGTLASTPKDFFFAASK